MKYLTSLLLIMSFIGIAVFGFAIFDHGMHNPNSDCVASVVDGVACPTNIVSMALHHISVLQTFSQTLAPSTVLILLLSLLLIATSFFIFRKDLLYLQLILLSHRYKDSVKLPNQQKITSWLALFERSPSLQ